MPAATDQPIIRRAAARPLGVPGAEHPPDHHLAGDRECVERMPAAHYDQGARAP